MANEAFFVDGGSYVAEEFRRLLKTFYYSADPLGGVISGLAVVQGSGSSVKVQVGAAFVNDSAGGAYIGATQADSAPITITPAGGTERTDRVYAVMNDPGSGATAGEMAFGVSPGSTSIPALAVPLADVTAKVDGTLSIADIRVQVQSGEGHSTDTGWVRVATKNGWTAVGGAISAPGVSNPALGLFVRRRGKVVQLIGGIQEPTTPAVSPGWTHRLVAPYDLPATLPAWATPLYTQAFPASTNNTARGDSSLGVATVTVFGTANPSTYPGAGAGVLEVLMPPDPDGADAVYISHTWLVE